MQKIIGKLQIPDNREFGKAFGLVLLAISMLLLLLGNLFAGLTFGISGLMVVILRSIYPRALTPLNVVWMGFGYIIGIVARPLAFGAIFYLIVSPLAITQRLFRRDELRLTPSLDTQWVSRPDEAEIPDFTRQF